MRVRPKEPARSVPPRLKTTGHVEKFLMYWSKSMAKCSRKCVPQ